MFNEQCLVSYSGCCWTPSIKMSQNSPPFILMGDVTPTFCIILSEGADRQMDTIQGPILPLMHHSSVFSLMYTHESFRARMCRKTLVLICMNGDNGSVALIFTQGGSLFLFNTISKLDYMFK